MIISSIVGMIAKGIGDQVVTYLKDRRAEVLFEDMQGEVLEGWMYKIKVAIRDEHRRHNVPHETHTKVMDAVEAVIQKEVDTSKL